jgi:hypothetical protein
MNEIHPPTQAQKESARRHVSIIDILFAVSIGAGFTVGFYDLRNEIATLEILRNTELGQTFARLVLAYVVITVSWFHFHRSVGELRDYPWSEFLADLLIYYTYLMLFAFIEHPPAFYFMLTAVWGLYTISMMATSVAGWKSIAFRLAFTAAFLMLAVSANFATGAGAEWMRLILAGAFVILFRTAPRARSKSAL